MTKIIGIIPVRMGSTRFPGKPLKKILSISLLRHVYERSLFFKKWYHLTFAICDNEVAKYLKKNNIPFVWTSKKHERCLDRVSEAANKIKKELNLSGNDLIICIQGDEPMLNPDMFKKIYNFHKLHEVKSTVLCMKIVDKKQYEDLNVVKVVSDRNKKILYQSRRPIPFTQKFKKSIGAKRIYGIFGFKFSYLMEFTKMKSSNLEILESCDTNRLCFHGKEQYAIDYNFYPSYSVDRPSHINIVTRYLKKDKLFKKYKSLNEL